MKELPASVVADDVLAVVLTRAGRVPAGADEAVAEAGGLVLLAGDDPGPGIDALPSARRVWLAPTVCASGAAARALAPALAGVQLLILPASPDGRDLAPRLAAELDRPLLAGATRCSLDGGAVSADLLRVDGQVVVPVTTHRAAVATLWPGSRGPEPAGQQPDV
ncbi:MAG: hypothetical protein JO337_09155, partial [Acidimicrobiales bacterium]|nr:hypothetical protein [Acidimicrobiales bacterium]